MSTRVAFGLVKWRWSVCCWWLFGVAQELSFLKDAGGLKGVGYDVSTTYIHCKFSRVKVSND